MAIPPREQRRTLLWVGEGLAEQVFLQHLKAAYLIRGEKAVTIKNAKGKGGKHVLDYTCRQLKQAEFDQIGMLLDTDTDWGDAQRAQASRKGIAVFESSPCLEAVLLRIAGQPVPKSTEHCKRAFFDHFQKHAHDRALYERHFPKEVLDAARTRIAMLDDLLTFLSAR